MKTNLSLDLSKTLGMANLEAIRPFAPFAEEALRAVREKSGLGNDYLGWVDLPEAYDATEFRRIGEAAARIQAMADALVVIGIGGSYLGSRSAIDLLGPAFRNELSSSKRSGVRIYYLGHTMSADYVSDFLDVIEGQDICVNVISKSGTTTEPAVAFRMMKAYLEEKYGKEGACERIFATTDADKGALKGLAQKEGYEQFVVPSDVGGRYSVLTAVGLLPMACAGIPIDQVMAGAKAARAHYLSAPFAENPVLQYACARNALARSGKEVELLVSYELRFQYFQEWWKQLYGESEGKDGRGIFPASVIFSTDLHSMGQYIQDGRRMLFETVLRVQKPQRDVKILKDPANLDGLNFLAEKSLHEVNDYAFQGTVIAHNDGGVPNLILQLPQITPEGYGELVYFFELACAVSGYLLGVNPFNQPGVEAYKKNMFALLGKPGYEELAQRLKEKLN
ncbi:Glucose-6-phosphate isomerase [Clostridiaceae bacterium JG1575]|nr:Glucose-6-phosphate isomerase [Clostridiaceae bacterium JG1575]